MLKLINHIIKEDNTCHGASLQVRQFTQNCAHKIATIKIACILKNSELSRIGQKKQGSREQGAGVPKSQTKLDRLVLKIRNTPRVTQMKPVQFCPVLVQGGRGWDEACTPPLLRAPFQGGASLRDAPRTYPCFDQAPRRGEGLAPPAKSPLPLCLFGDWATRKNWWYQWLYCSCNFIFYSKFQAIALITPYSDNGKFHHQYKLLGEKKRGNWGYKINAEKNSSKDIKEEKKLYLSILRKDKYTSLELAFATQVRIMYKRLALGKVALFYRDRG